MGDLRNAFAKGFITTQAGGGEKPFLKVTFPDLLSVWAAHDALIKAMREPDEDQAAVNRIIAMSDEEILADTQPGDEESVQRAFDAAKARVQGGSFERECALISQAEGEGRA